MPYPTRLLDEGEEVVLDVRPHWSCLARPLVLALAAMAGAIATLVVGGIPVVATEALLALLLASLLWLGVRYLRWATTSLAVTTQRVVLRRGVLGRRQREILLNRINDLSFDQSLGQRVLGYGTLRLDSGGERGLEVMNRVPRPSAVQRAITNQVERSRRGATDPWHPLTIPEQIEKLDELRRRGFISQDELEVKRAQLLDRW